MPNPMVERFEQLLSQDPASTVFVELAKALLESQDTSRALQVCEQGLTHHPRSVLGRVLWGKSLIMLGRPAEAMEQFDKAVAEDRENPHAYNLIAEVLLKKGLYRSALPLLRKAAQLQPDDARIQGWFTKTQSALAGGPSVVLEDESLLATATEETTSPRARAAAAVLAAAPAPGSSPTAEGSNGMAAPAPSTNGTPTAVTTSAPVPFPDLDLPPPPSFSNGSVSEEASAPLGVVQLTAADESSGTESGLAPLDAVPSTEASDGASAGAEGGDLGLLGDIPAPVEAAPLAHPTLEDFPAAPEAEGSGEGLLADLPSLEPKPVSFSLPKVEVTAQAREAIAKEYERELRQQLAAKAEEKSFLQRHGIKLAVAIVLTLGVGTAVGGFFYTRANNHGHDLAGLLASARKSFVLDTARGYRQGVEDLTQALAMDSSCEDGWAKLAFGKAALFAEHGRHEEDRSAANRALGQPAAQGQAPGMVLAARYFLADSTEKDAAAKEVLDSTLASAEVYELQGELLLAQHKEKEAKRALDLLSKAAQANNVRALVALGDYYKDSADYAKALEFYDTAAKLSPQHVALVVSEAECRLALWQDFAQGLEDLEKLPKDEEVSEELALRRDLAHARLLGANGESQKALELVGRLRGGEKSPSLGLAMAEGEVDRLSGDMPAAEKAYQSALKVDGKNDLAKEGLGRALLAQDRAKDVLEKVVADDGSKRALVVRAAAYYRMGDWAHVRSELQKTQVKGKFPVDSVVYLALADAAESKEDVAKPALEKLRQSLHHPKPELTVALGTLYWHEGKTEKARELFEDAMKDPLDYEGACSLGRLLLASGATEKALGAFKTAVSRNGSHAEARRALVTLLLGQGKTDEGFTEAHGWQVANPGSGPANSALALALMQKGAFSDAALAGSQAVRLDPKDAESHRVYSELLYQRGDGRAAFAELQEANKLNPKDAETFCDIGRAFIRQGNLDNAPAAFGAALRESSSLACGKIGKVAGRPPTAKAELKELEDLVEKAPAVWDRAWAAAVVARGELAAGKLEAAKKYAEQALELGPYLADASYAAGLVALRAKETDKGNELLGKAVGLSPTDASYHLAYADELYRSQKDTGHAYSEYELFLRLAPPKSPESARVKKLLPTLKKHLARK
jgi:tetratricopeptide (TPR) repeat protein